MPTWKTPRREAAGMPAAQEGGDSQSKKGLLGPGEGATAAAGLQTGVREDATHRVQCPLGLSPWPPHLLTQVNSSDDLSTFCLADGGPPWGHLASCLNSP